MKRFALFLTAVMLITSVILPCSAEELTEKGVLTDLGIPMRTYISDASQYLYARNVWDIEEYNGKVYVGSGDFDRNSGTNATGGSPVLAYDIEKGTWSRDYICADEQISRFIKARGNLYIPAQDPTGASGNIYSLVNGIWSTQSNITYGTHVFDLEFDDDGVYSYASLGCDYTIAPIVSVSDDGGRRYRSSYFRKDGYTLKGKNLSLEGADTGKIFARSYNLFNYRGEIYATLRFSLNGLTDAQSAAYRAYEGIYKFNKDERVFDYQGNAPYEILRNSMAPSSDAVFNDRVVIAYGSMKVSDNDNLTAWKDVTGFTGSVTAMEVIGNELYFWTYEAKAGGYTNRLYRTTDLESFEEAYSFDDVNYIRSMCYCDGVFYIGTENARNAVNAKTGTVYSLVLNKENCIHGNSVTEYTSSALKTTKVEEETVTEVINGKYSVSCPECGEVFGKYSHPFNDLKVTWYTEPVLKAYEMSMINGSSINTFVPDGNTTRAHLVTVLYNMEGKPDVSDVDTPLTDINGWYNDAIKWAYDAGVVNGKTATTFAPNENVTREQFAAILYRYAQYKKVATTDRADLSGYKDAGKISSYANDAMSWANARGYIGGVSATTISPKTGATRAQMATILVRYVEDNK